jgi:competence protein ComEC
LALIGMSAVGMGGARYLAAVPSIDSSHVSFYNGRHEVAITGLVVEEADIRDRSISLRLDVESISFSDKRDLPVRGTILVLASRFPVIAYGTRIQVLGDLEIPPEDQSFSYRKYLARHGIHSLITFPELTVLAENQGNLIRHSIFAIKRTAQRTIDRLIPGPQAALLKGILLGDDSGMTSDMADAFRRTGLTHIIAISGFNITILIGVLLRMSETFLSRWAAVVLAMTGVGLYTILVGADASVVRAAIMGSIYLFTTRQLGQRTYPYASLFLAGILMTLVEPLALWDIGFQLSFAATMGLMLYAAPLGNWLQRRLMKALPERTVRRVMKVLMDSIIVTFAAQILTLPLTIYYFEQFSLVSLLSNFLVLPAQPGVMIWGGLATIMGIIIPAVGQLLAYVAWLFLAYTTWMVDLFAGIPGAFVSVRVSGIGVILIYASVAAVTWLAMHGQERRSAIWERLRPKLSLWVVLSSSMLISILVIAWAMTQPDGRLHVVFFDVGQGDAIFIQTPSGRQLLVDGGLYPTVLNEHLGRRMPFWDRTLDIVVATHPDADHVSGLPDVLERYRVVQLITDGEELGVSPVYDEVLTAAENAGVEIHGAVSGEEIVIDDGVRIEILHPGPARIGGSQNDNSVSLRLVYGDFSLLLTGDAEEPAERAMTTAGRLLSAVVFKAGHHGSRSSSNDFFLEAVLPKIVIISAGKDNQYGHPHPEVLRRATAVDATILRTDELGTIEVITDGQEMWWEVGP